jgi:Condensation domain
MSIREVPASIGQRLLWFLEHYRPDSASLNCPLVCKLHGSLNVNDLEAAVNRLAERHEALRTTLVRRGRALVQQIHAPSNVPLALRLLDAAPDQEDAGPSRAGIEKRFRSELETELRTPVDIGASPFRTTLWRLGPGEHVLCLNTHHLVSDAWSCGIVVQDLLKMLDAGPGGLPALRPVQWQYGDFAHWQSAQAASGGLRPHQDYWMKQLQGVRLVRLAPPVAVSGKRRMTVTTADLDAATFGQLRLLARTERTTIFAVMLAVYYMQLYRMTGQEDLALASLFANRARREVQSTVGFFANMVVLRTVIDPQDRFVDVVRKVRGTVIGALMHEAIPCQMLPLKLGDDGGRVDDLVFQMLPTPPPGAKISAGGLDLELYTPDSLGSRFGIELGLIPQQTGECRAMLFSTEEQFSSAQARAFLDEYLALARAAALRPNDRRAAAAV